MLEGLNAAAAGMVAQQARMDALAEDVANVSTTGYKHQRIAFHELVYAPAGPAAAARVATGVGASVDTAGRSLAQGNLQPTGRPLDLGLQGPGFFQVRRPDGTVALTRAGSMQLDAKGRLVTDSGDRVDPPIQVAPGTAPDRLAIREDGTVSVGNRQIGRLRVVDVAAPEQLLSAGNDTYVATAASGAPRPVTGTTVTQGSIEGSNVDVADSMVDMIDAQRSYTLASRAVQIQDQMLEVANGIKK
jgi:flagellar basal-body rod protein FlgG